ncbi:MAG: hypothetical protein O7D96_05895, partial [SAR324 cluster bacterium]|nr:hypothetical protein [SAR324 cluster bacterium]
RDPILTMVTRNKQGFARGWPPVRFPAAVCLLAAALWLAAFPALGQEPAEDEFVEMDAAAELGLEGEQPQAAPPGNTFNRLVFFEFTQLSYKQHPFFQITGQTVFRNGKSVTTTTEVATPTTASDEGIFEKALHSLPPFSIEVGTSMNLIFPRSISIGFEYLRASQTDADAVNTSKSSITIERILMDTYYYSAVVRAYAFDANEPGVNYFLGVGLGALNGKFNAKLNTGTPTETVGFSESPIGMQHFGLEWMGEEFGLRYEIRIVNARKVRLDSNPYSNSTATTINFSGTMTRLSLVYQF